jgi:hypothetical protein
MGCASFGPQSLKKISVPSSVLMNPLLMMVSPVACCVVRLRARARPGIVAIAARLAAPARISRRVR